MNSDETFDKKNPNQKTPVFLKEKFKPVYECLFKSSNPSQEVNIAGGNISADGKNFIMEIMSLMKASQNLKGGNNGTK